MKKNTYVLLVDNGSYQAAAVDNLRRITSSLRQLTGKQHIYAVSLLHSDKIPAEKLEDNKPAEVLAKFIQRQYLAGQQHFLVVPLFFGRSAAIYEYIPQCVAEWRQSMPNLSIAIAENLAPITPKIKITNIVEMLSDYIRQQILAEEKPYVILVDHGTPRKQVSTLRDKVAAELQQELQGEVKQLWASSMESREGKEYAFNKPLLEEVLRYPVIEEKAPIIVALLFISPGRHAGEGGDISQICLQAQQDNPKLGEIRFTKLLGYHPQFIALLEERMLAACEQYQVVVD